MDSYRKIDYRVRPGKYAERLMMIESFRRLRFATIESYQYVGLGSVYFSDFYLIHRALPPRSLKSFMGSICLPAWILGHNPAERIICASYGHKLSKEFAFETRRLMQSQWYRAIFPQTHLDPKKTNLEVLATTRGGQRRATSVGGSLTGLGGNLIIIDDPIKAGDAHSEVARENAIQWYSSTVASRLDDPKKGRIILIAQRLHMEDLPGHLLAQGEWQHLNLPLVEWKDREIEIAPDTILSRPAGDIAQGVYYKWSEAKLANGQRLYGSWQAQAGRRHVACRKY